MDIYIKSFNRPYLLERVLQSIVRYVKGFDKVVILEDGTPKIYLDRIQKDFPFVQFRYSPDYERKAQGERAKMAAPTEFWRKEIEKATDYFLLIEDDIWIYQEIDLKNAEQLCKANEISILKLKWWGNEKLVNGTTVTLDDSNELLLPKMKFASETLVKNRYFLHSLLILLKIMPKNYFLEMYSIYDVAGIIFSREYYLHVWPKNQNFIQEMIQLGKAAEWFRTHKNKKVAKSKNEACLTTFVSSATGNKDKLGFDMDLINDILNKAWYEQKLDSMLQFPKDMRLDYVQSFLEGHIHPQQIDAWRNWSYSFRRNFTNMGSSLIAYNNMDEVPPEN
ncbi:hypothetical protein [Sphingobacterium multivorum]|uniref:Glycosyltransferase family 2 protein n=1 Tax=Sphingobacterium multivorum TaxID=28454 RepID=A0A2X2J2N8_SPHMU|nr:hypothetical protein [Sphingobacterium multivorum]QRQ61297.1 hypothetical protein I6J33_24910 [Sphingobacterium multivorum]SPZ88647.1 Uncharacterised protein [Sphingobacterium multivorum]